MHESTSTTGGEARGCFALMAYFFRFAFFSFSSSFFRSAGLTRSAASNACSGVSGCKLRAFFGRVLAGCFMAATYLEPG